MTLVFTKCDKRKKKKNGGRRPEENLQDFLELIQKFFQTVPPWIMTSSVTNQGRDEILLHMSQLRNYWLKHWVGNYWLKHWVGSICLIGPVTLNFVQHLYTNQYWQLFTEESHKWRLSARACRLPWNLEAWVTGIKGTKEPSGGCFNQFLLLLCLLTTSYPSRIPGQRAWH